MTIDLCWTDIISVSEINYTNEDQGIYIWGFEINKKFIPYYVGIAYNIQARITEHISSIIGGRYCIIHSENLKKFYNYKETENISENSGLLYIPNFPEGYNQFLRNKKRLQPHIDNMVEKMCFTYSAFNDEKITKKDLELIEKICIEKIGKEKLWNTRGGKSENIFINSITGDKRVVDLFD
jgi:hypothetical protein